MYFKLDFTIRDIYLDKDIVEINYGGAHEINVTLRIPTEEELAIGYTKSTFFCIVVGRWTPKDNFLAAFRNLAENKMPKGSKKTDEWSIYNIDQDGNMKYKTTIPPRFLPDAFVSFLEQIRQELDDHAKRTVNLLRWRCGTEGYHNPFSSRGGYWSFDGQTWEPLPVPRTAHAWASPYIRTSDEILNNAKTYLLEGKNHPLGHELYLEAWEQRHQNPRSSLIIGIAAAETGLKQCISAFVPDAKWLIENTASPELIKILSEYLPSLPTIRKVNKKVFEPKSYIYEVLKKGVQMRNQIVHGRATSITYETLKEILLAVHDVLWIIDYCSGYGWALEHIRPDIRKILEE